MSTAARPTFHAAQAKSSAGAAISLNHNVSVKDQNAHSKMKYRQYGQANSDEMQTKNLKANLESQEKQLLKNNDENFHVKSSIREVTSIKLLKNESENIDIDEIKKKFDDEDFSNDDEDFDSRFVYSQIYIILI